MYWQLEMFTKQTWLCHGKGMWSREGATGDFPASEVCPALSLRCWGDRALGFFHYTRFLLLVWFTQYALAASAGFCGSNSAARAEAQTLPGLHSKYNTHEEETSINNLFSPVKDDIVLRSLVPLHFVNLLVPAGCCKRNYSKHKQKISTDGVMQIRGACVPAGSNRMVPLTSPSIALPGMGARAELLWPSASEGSWDTRLDRTVSLPFTARRFLTTRFFFMTVLWRWVPFWWWAPWEQRLCPFLVPIIPQVRWQCVAHGKWSVIIRWLNATTPFRYSSPLGLSKSFWIRKVPSAFTKCYQTRVRVGNHPLVEA